MTCQSLLVDLLALLLPAEVFRPLSASHRHGHVNGTFRSRPSTLPSHSRQAADREKFKKYIQKKSQWKVSYATGNFFFRDSLSTLSPSLIQSSRCQSLALPSSSRVSCCPLCGPCPVWGQNASGHPGSCESACLRPAGGGEYC